MTQHRKPHDMPAYLWEEEETNGAQNGHGRENPLLAGRYDLGDAIEQGIEPPEELEPSLLLAGKVHSIYAGAGKGKSWLALWLVKQALDRGESVLLLDSENGPRIMAERLQQLGTDPQKTRELLHYLPFPTLSIPDAVAYEEALDKLQPSLVIFDSFVNFLASAGCEENSNDDVARWAVSFTHPARKRGAAVVLLDHVPHEGNHARGATRKKDEVDVQWKLHLTQPFSRSSVGEIVLHCEKDREGWLPASVKFSVGGGSDGLVFTRSSGTVEVPDPSDSLTPSAQKALTIISEREEGPRWKDLRDEFGGSTGSLSNALNELKRLNIICQDEVSKRYHLIEPQNLTNEPDMESSMVFNQGSIEQVEPGESGGVQPVHTPLGGEQLNPDAEHLDGENSKPEYHRLTEDQNEAVRNLVDQGFSVAAARAEVLGEEPGKE